MIDCTFEPINKIAHMVTRQDGCSGLYLDKQGLIDAIGQIQKRRDFLKKKLGIRTKRSLRTLMYKFNRCHQNSSILIKGGNKRRDMFLELHRLGQNQKKLLEELAGLRNKK